MTHEANQVRVVRELTNRGVVALTIKSITIVTRFSLHCCRGTPDKEDQVVVVKEDKAYP